MCSAILLTFTFLSVTLAAAWPSYGQYYKRVPSQDYLDDRYYQREPSSEYRYLPPAQIYEPDYRKASEFYYYHPFERFAELEDPVRQEERLAREAALPIGQEMLYEGESAEPRWRATTNDDVNAAFLQNLIIAEMAKDASNRAQSRVSHPIFTGNPFYGSEETDNVDNEVQLEDEDVRELKALAGKPLYHVAKTESPKSKHFKEEEQRVDYYDYPADDTFINWNSKRSAPQNTIELPSTTTTHPVMATTTQAPEMGQDEQYVPTQRYTYSEPAPVKQLHHKRAPSGLEALKRFLAEEMTTNPESQEVKRSRIEKRFVAPQTDLVEELRGLKRRILI